MKRLLNVLEILSLMGMIILIVFNYGTGRVRYKYASDGDYIYVLKIKQRALWGYGTVLYRIDINSNKRPERYFRTNKLYDGVLIDDEYLYFYSFDWFKEAMYTTGIFRLKKHSSFDLHSIEPISDAYYLAHASDKSRIGSLRVINMKLYRSFSIGNNSCIYPMDKE